MRKWVIPHEFPQTPIWGIEKELFLTKRPSQSPQSGPTMGDKALKAIIVVCVVIIVVVVLSLI